MSYTVVIFDASTLILLAKVEVLPLVVGRLTAVITPQVAREATRQPSRWDARVIQALLDKRRISIQRAEPAFTKRLAEDFRLDVGEASTLALAKRREGVVGTDDGVAIKACKLLQIPFVTALHMLMEAHERRLVDRSAALVKMEQLQKIGRYHPRILEAALASLIKGGQSS